MERVKILCILLLFNYTTTNINAVKCIWAKTCDCDEGVSIVGDYICDYNNMIGHSVAKCLDQQTFPNFSSTTVNELTEISGSFKTVPSKAFAYPQYSPRCCVYITSSSDNLVVEPSAFVGSSGTFVIKNTKNVTLTQNSIETTTTDGCNLALFNVDNVYLPKSFRYHLAPNEDPSTVIRDRSLGMHSLQLIIENSTLRNLDKNTFGFNTNLVLQVELKYIRATNFKEIVDLFTVTPTKRINKLTIYNWPEKDHVDFSMEWKNVTILNDNRLIDFGLPIEKVSSIEFDSPIPIGDTFDGLSMFNTSLKKFICYECNLSKIPSGLSYMTKLEELSLSKNRISTILNNALISSKLTSINLADNQISLINPEAFNKLISLKYLYLSGNPIGSTNLPSLNALGKLPALIYFSCSVCQLASIPTMISNKPNLEDLTLNGNQINEIRARDFQGASSLTRLELSDNSILTLERGTFYYLPKLSIYLNNNSFTEFDVYNVSKYSADESMSIELDKSRYLKKVYNSNPSKANLNCPHLSISSTITPLAEIDPNLMVHCSNPPEPYIVSFVANNISCKSDFLWLARLLVPPNGRCDDIKPYYYSKISYQQTKCAGTDILFEDYLWAKYFSKFPECSEPHIPPFNLVNLDVIN